MQFEGLKLTDDEKNIELKMIEKNNRVLIVGGGIGGIRSALDLAEAGRDVVLVDKAYSIGGFMTQLDRTFPTNNCDLCTLSPSLSESGRQNHIELLTITRLDHLEGEAGNFTATLVTSPRYIDMDKCTACGDCYEKFADCVRFTPGLDHRAPTCMRYPRSTPQAYSVDIEKCNNINSLIDVCQAGAILPNDKEHVQKVNVGAVVIATGAELFNPDVMDNFGGGRYPNVVSGMEYERIMSASGPTLGSLVRPSDNKQPKKIAWIQCVGSRGINKTDVPYCSSVCCMYALKEAIVTKERFQDEIETSIFYMDMRTYGKGYEVYLDRAKKDYNIKLIRSRPHSVIQIPETDDLSISYVLSKSSTILTETFDMVVLSTGFRISTDMINLAEKLDIDLNEYHFAETSDFNPVETSRPGIYVCGLFESPKDIPETIVQASAAACMASGNLKILEKASQIEDELPPEIDVRHQKPKIGVFICECGSNIGGALSVPEIVSYVKHLPDVIISEAVGYGCSLEALKHISDVIKEQNLNRVVIGGCSPRTHESKFQDMVKKSGLNKYLVEIANIRDQDTWVHKENALDKAKELIRMAVYGVKRRRPLTDHVLPVNRNVLIAGGGVTGMTAALNLAKQGFKVYLIERASQLGGVGKQIRKTLANEDVQTHLQNLVHQVVKNNRIELITSSVIVDHKGMPGMFTTGIQIAPRMYYRQIRHGAVIIATGAVPNRPNEYLLDKHKSVITQIDLDSIIEDYPEQVNAWKTIVMIQCVGSRTLGNPNCSRICCQTAIKNALRIIEKNSDTRIIILNRGIRTFGFQENYYRYAREKGIVFARYEATQKPEVKAKNDNVGITFKDEILNRNVEVSADKLILSTGMTADDETTEDLAAIFHLQRTEDGYFLEDHIKLRPVDLSTPGFFVAGTAHGPKTIRESIVQANAAVSRTLKFLARDRINLGANVAKVDDKKCASCLICVRACPYNIPYINADGYSQIDPALCHGCGTCAAECPAKAIQLVQYEDDIISAELEGLLERMN